MSLDEQVRILGRGPGRSRDLTDEEAREAMRRMVEQAQKGETFSTGKDNPTKMPSRIFGWPCQMFAGLSLQNWPC